MTMFFVRTHLWTDVDNLSFAQNKQEENPRTLANRPLPVPNDKNDLVGFELILLKVRSWNPRCERETIALEPFLVCRPLSGPTCANI